MSKRSSAGEPEREPGPTEPGSTAISRRALLAGAAGAAAAGLATRLPLPKSADAQSPPAPPRSVDTTKVQGPGPSALGRRSPFEQPERGVYTISSGTPHELLDGIITPSDLHFERHHGGVPQVDPSHYSLLIHGMVERPTVFTLEDLRRLPSVSMIRFLECSGNFWRDAPEDARPQDIAPLTSTSEWTGVPLAVLFQEVGVLSGARWFLAEGQDAAVMTRSIPVEKAYDDAIIAYGQNGEALRPEQGYPARLLCPGWEGNASVKWIRRIELSDRPFMTREETSRYTEQLKDGSARQFSFVMDARSIITAPAYPTRIAAGWHEIRGIAWSGRGRIARAELSFDEGRTWRAAAVQEPVLPKAHTRFRYMWQWDGREGTVLSRAVDETGYVQPTVRELVEARGPGAGPYHLNPITGFRVHTDGRVVFRTEPWQPEITT
jgi:sulfane dehydrogenase subunit SoxC